MRLESKDNPDAAAAIFRWAVFLGRSTVVLRRCVTVRPVGVSCRPSRDHILELPATGEC